MPDSQSFFEGRTGCNDFGHKIFMIVRVASFVFGQVLMVDCFHELFSLLFLFAGLQLKVFFDFACVFGRQGRKFFIFQVN